MERWRKQGENYSHEVTRTRSNYKKPPLGSWQPTVPAWEKKFCTMVGSVRWEKIVETKRCMHLYGKVVDWDDSAGEEAFRNAKSRFYSDMHGLPCAISLPDPDMYIDEIDWNKSEIDPNLIQDLECSNSLDLNSNKEQVVIFGNILLSDQGFSPMGWGDGEEEIKKATNQSFSPTGWGDDGNEINKAGNQGLSPTGWGDCEEEIRKETIQPTGWEDGEQEIKQATKPSLEKRSNPWEQKHGQNNGYFETGKGWESFHASSNKAYKGDGVWNKSFDWEDINNGRRDGSGRLMSRYRTSRFNDNNQRNYSWRKKVNIVS